MFTRENWGLNMVRECSRKAPSVLKMLVPKSGASCALRRGAGLEIGELGRMEGLQVAWVVGHDCFAAFEGAVTHCAMHF